MIFVLGDINVLVLTDTHSWIGGHARQESPKLTADYGDVVSLYQNLKSYSDKMGQDLWFVMNGDWIDGTGLALDGDPSYLIPLLQKMPWDAVNCKSKMKPLVVFALCFPPLSFKTFVFISAVRTVICSHCCMLSEKIFFPSYLSLALDLLQ